MPEKNTRSPQPAPPHDLILEGRARLTVTGVQKVLHCNADSAAIETGRGILHLAGAQLSMAALDLEAGEAKFTGRIDALEYTASAPAGQLSAPPAAMIPVLPPSAIAQELTACTVLGGCTRCGAGRVPGQGPGGVGARFSMGGHGADPAAELCGGAEPAGVLRWYMAAAGFAGAGAAAFVLGVPLRAAGKALQRRVLRPAAQRRVRQQNARKLRRNAKRTAKKAQKELAKPAPDDV